MIFCASWYQRKVLRTVYFQRVDLIPTNSPFSKLAGIFHEQNMMQKFYSCQESWNSYL